MAADLLLELVVPRYPGNRGPWTTSTTYRMDIIRSLECGARKMRRLGYGHVVGLCIKSEHLERICITQEIIDHVRYGGIHDFHAPDASVNSNDRRFPESIYGTKIIIDEEAEQPTLNCVNDDGESAQIVFTGAVA